MNIKKNSFYVIQNFQNRFIDPSFDKKKKEYKLKQDKSRQNYVSETF